MQRLSIRKYATLIGVSHTAVTKALKVGYISNGWDPVLKKVIVEIADTEWGNAIKDKNKTGENFGETNLTEHDYIPTKKDISFSEARRKKEIYNAEIARITALKEQGLYIDREKVFKELFEFGKQIRLDFQSIPDQVIDLVLAAKTRYEAKNILSEAIHNTLEKLTAAPIS